MERNAAKADSSCSTNPGSPDPARDSYPEITKNLECLALTAVYVSSFSPSFVSLASDSFGHSRLDAYDPGPGCRRVFAEFPRRATSNTGALRFSHRVARTVVDSSMLRNTNISSMSPSR